MDLWQICFFWGGGCGTLHPLHPLATNQHICTLFKLTWIDTLWSEIPYYHKLTMTSMSLLGKLQLKKLDGCQPFSKFSVLFLFLFPIYSCKRRQSPRGQTKTEETAVKSRWWGKWFFIFRPVHVICRNITGGKGVDLPSPFWLTFICKKPSSFNSGPLIVLNNNLSCATNHRPIIILL